MFVIISILCLLFHTKPMFCQRRIINGVVADGDTGYMVYLIKAHQSNKSYVGWMCGGSIVHPMYVLTAAACVIDVKYLYVISGYRKYVPTDLLQSDECTKRFKKRIIQTYEPKDLVFKYPSFYHMDIALAKVESRFEFANKDYLTYCSYRPRVIPVNYMKIFTQPGTPVISLGWGHTKFFRPEGDERDYNMMDLRYGSIRILDKEECKKQYTFQKEMSSNIDKYLICTNGTSSINIEGQVLSVAKPRHLVNECLNQTDSKECMDEYVSRRTINSKNERFSHYFSLQYSGRRTAGPCQNDHGGPLIAWVGGREMVVGVTSAFQVNTNMECQGPFIYTNTVCVSQFIYCTIQKTRRYDICDDDNENNIKMQENDLKWDDLKEYM